MENINQFIRNWKKKTKNNIWYWAISAEDNLRPKPKAQSEWIIPFAKTNEAKSALVKFRREADAARVHRARAVWVYTGGESKSNPPS